MKNIDDVENIKKKMKEVGCQTINYLIITLGIPSMKTVIFT